MIFIERYPLKRCQGCVKLIASKVNCCLNINDLSEVQLCMSSNSRTWECPHTKDGADHVPLIFLSSVYWTSMLIFGWTSNASICEVTIDFIEFIIIFYVSWMNLVYQVWRSGDGQCTWMSRWLWSSGSPIIFCVGLLGNSAFIFVVARLPSMGTTTNFYLINLAISDTMVPVCLDRLQIYLTCGVPTDAVLLGKAGCILNYPVVYTSPAAYQYDSHHRTFSWALHRRVSSTTSPVGQRPR